MQVTIQLHKQLEEEKSRKGKQVDGKGHNYHGAAMAEQRATVTCPPHCLPLTAPIGARRGRAARVAEATGLGRPCAAAALAVGLRAGR